MISFDGCKLHVVVEAREDAPTILLSHYLGGEAETFDALAGMHLRSSTP